MAGESNFSLQIANLVGGATIDQEFCDDAAGDACKEIINQLPAKLKAKCATRSTLNDSATTLDLDSKGDILHVVRLSADSGGYQLSCREIPAEYGDLTNDSTDLNYFATVTDPVYWITSNSSGNPTLFVKPLPTANQPAYVHHISYPTVDVSASTVEIANFPDEATYLVVLYAATRQLLKFQATMSASWNSDITTALTNAQNVINNNQPSATTDAYGALNNEDIELMTASLQLAASQLTEAGGRLQQDSTKYQWYGDQYSKLTAEYVRGLAALKGG